MDKIERRCFAVQELRAESADGKKVIRGHAAVFDSWSQDLGGFRERIAPGAFADTIARGDEILATFNHKREMVLGATFNGSLSLAEDATGLAVRIALPDTQIGRDAYALVDGGYVRGWSFAFPTPGREDQEWRRGPAGGPDERILKRLTLKDVCLATDPAYLAASDAHVSRRSYEEFIEECKPEPGYPISLAKARLALQ